jgi:hypothetical protein
VACLYEQDNNFRCIKFRKCLEKLKGCHTPETNSSSWKYSSCYALIKYALNQIWSDSVEILLPAIVTYLLTPWCRVLLEKLTCLQLVKKFPAFYGTRRFITALTSVRRLSVSWASPMQSPYPHPSSWRSILILSTHLRLGLPSGSAIVTVH